MEVVESVRFGFMSDDEVRKHSVIKITNPHLLDMRGTPISGGLYDPAMGPLDSISPCKSCGQRPYQCNGHCGHIDLVSPVYNPLLFNLLHNILKKTCFKCFQFQSSRGEVQNVVSQLELIAKGDVVGAKKLSLRLGLLDKKNQIWAQMADDAEMEDSHGSQVSRSSSITDGGSCVEDSERKGCWDSCQLTEALSVMNEFFRRKSSAKRPKCINCKHMNPKIKKPSFGRFQLAGMSPTQIRANIIRNINLDVTYSGESEDKLSSEVASASASARSWNSDSETVEATSFISATDDTERLKKKHKNRAKDLTKALEESTNYSSGNLLPSEVRDILKRVWENEEPLCSYICDVQQQKCNLSGEAAGYSMFFLETVFVPPIKFRPPARGGDSVMEHPQTLLLGKVIQSNVALGNSHVNNSERSMIVKRWFDLQQSINVLFDSKAATSQIQKDETSGICQLLEKKEGIFRQKMMGKRVNHACRSVISPDPYLSVNEIGIPPYFALKLTYPERVTPWNAAKLRSAVINGPEIHPGATTYSDSVSTMNLQLNKKMRLAVSRKLPSSRGVVAQSGKSEEFEGKVVCRHLQDGDIVLVNRQPTLHKPSIMAHVVRILKGEKTLRMHYANCSSFNADFDGDEINVHFPQDEISRAEAYNIVNANEQYIVPTRGDTVRGLIQDHIVSAVLLTMKSTFLTRSEFCQLLYGSGVYAVGTGSLSGKISQKISVVDSEGIVESVLPAIWKPEPLWTGKQVITALLSHITRGQAPCTVKNQAKIPKTYFSGNSGKNEEEDDSQNAEHNLLIWKNELVRGVIDKAQFGKFGLVHTVQELYGCNSAGILLSALSRLFTIFLQIHGFTCGVDDLIIIPDYDVQRKEKLEGEDVGEEVHCEFVNFRPGQIGPEELQLEIEKVICSDGESATALLDMKMKNKLTNKLTREGSQILKHLLTVGLLKPFPKNCIAVMTTTGAKGSTVNFQQISAYLGQQELEGKRVPRMVSGKTLPSFPPWDFTSRAGGFITDRFLSGLRPQEYYFHCMAGREGLVDTAVKTSRSGYLQRCLIKNLESLKVCYDYTVRDADGAIIQFYYGEDGVDVHRTSFLKNFKALEENQEIVGQKYRDKREFDAYIRKLPEGLEAEARHYIQQARETTHVRERQNTIKKESSMRKEKKLQDNFLQLVKQKYLSSLAPAGEPVGVIAAQSVGEPSTQMTLNTFHLAGRGEMNVTLGIPRLQEILMTASDYIKTPILTCPLSQLRTKRDVVALVSNVKKVTVADLVESVEVQLQIHNLHEATRIYKLIIKLKETEFVSLHDIHETLKSVFLRELDDALEKHVKFLSRLSGIENYSSSTLSEASSNIADEEVASISAQVDTDDDDVSGDFDQGDDLGSDVQKRKLQATDEMDYDDGSDAELGEDKKTDEDHLQDDENENDEAEISVNGDGSSSFQNADKSASKTKSSGDKDKITSEEIQKPIKESSSNEFHRAVFFEANALSFEVHFKLFTTEPHLLLAQIAQKTAQKVRIRRGGQISQCKMVEYDPDEKTVIWDDHKKPKKNDAENKQTSGQDTSYYAVKASGTDFKSFWDLKDLDLNRLYSNNITSMLNAYGVEAARATIIREVKQVFDIYGVKIDYRHLSLIADYMTHTGGYRPMSRHGSISESLSPFLKMSFETASKFIVEAASYGLTDNLETPSSRICLGMPVKMGTGCFDLMQKLDV